MKENLTLNLDKNVIEEAKSYAKSNNISLSKLIESYLSSLTGDRKEKIEITPLVESLIGVIDLPDDFNEKEAIREYLVNKHA